MFVSPTRSLTPCPLRCRLHFALLSLCSSNAYFAPFQLVSTPLARALSGEEARENQMRVHRRGMYELHGTRTMSDDHPLLKLLQQNRLLVQHIVYSSLLPSHLMFHWHRCEHFREDTFFCSKLLTLPPWSLSPSLSCQKSKKTNTLSFVAIIDFMAVPLNQSSPPLDHPCRSSSFSALTYSSFLCEKRWA